jgi:hypothetical protein
MYQDRVPADPMWVSDSAHPGSMSAGEGLVMRIFAVGDRDADDPFAPAIRARLTR